MIKTVFLHISADTGQDGVLIEWLKVFFVSGYPDEGG